MKNRYLMIFHYVIPADKTTSMKDYGKHGKKLLDERIKFRSTPNIKDISEATYIIDLKEARLTKNRNIDDMVSEEDVISHYFNEYKEDIATSLMLNE